MKDNIPPEEKLLRLIKNTSKNTETSTVEAIKTHKPFHPGVRQHFPIEKYLSKFSLRNIITVAFMGSVFYLISSLTYPFWGIKKITLPEVPREHANQKNIMQPAAKPLEFYLEASARPLFANAQLETAAQPAAIASADLMKDVALVGIISGENPQAIVEDKKAQKTYYLSKGQTMGEFQVEEILEGKIILNRNGERFELYL